MNFNILILLKFSASFVSIVFCLKSTQIVKNELKFYNLFIFMFNAKNKLGYLNSPVQTRVLFETKSSTFLFPAAMVTL